jgi:hypothetical protein
MIAPAMFHPPSFFSFTSLSEVVAARLRLRLQDLHGGFVLVRQWSVWTFYLPL